MTTTLFLPHLPEVVMNNNDSTVVYLGVGIDTARYAHHVSFLDQQKRTAAKPFHFSETAEGYQKLRAALDKLTRKHPRLHLQIRIDATGGHRPLGWSLPRTSCSGCIGSTWRPPSYASG
jgi:hypothetical protein